MNSSIVIRQLEKTYKTYEKPEGIIESLKGFWNRQYIQKTALHSTTLSLEQGRIIGLVGANGAGKTTLLKLLSGLIYPSTGTAEVLGFTPWERKADFLKQISILLGQKNQLWWDLPPIDSFALLAEIYDLDKMVAKERVQNLAELLDCKHVLTTQLRRLSLGERMKMEIIGALLHEPKVLFLDEPTIGLDVVAQTAIRNFLASYVKEKKPTVILTSHYMDDIAKLADDLLLISRGRIVYQGNVGDFTAKTDPKLKISFGLETPLDQEKQVLPGIVIPAHQQEIFFSVHKKDLNQSLVCVTQLTGVVNLKIEEVDFEDIIHEFLAQESRV